MTTFGKMDFSNLEKLPRAYFYTSNVEKYLQAKLVFTKFGLPLYHFRGRSKPYAEDYTSGTAGLLTAAIQEVLSQVGDRHIFFIEDTSIRIEALSSASLDVPGLAAKEWFASTSFVDLDEQLKKTGNRDCTVKSDIALYLPGHALPIFFHGETRGIIAAAPPEFAPSRAHPWLTSTSFNGWFIPDGARKRLGEMSFEESWTYDFRVRSLVKLIGRLEEYAHALNLPPTSYLSPSTIIAAQQPSLFQPRRPVFIVVGKPSAGKSEFGKYIAQEMAIPYFEGSDIVRAARELHAPRQSLDEFAAAYHKNFGQDKVARMIVEMVNGFEIMNGFVVAGFRHIEELDYIRRVYDETTVIYVDATERTRFERQLVRGRPDDSSNFKDFLAKDREQSVFTLPRFGRQLADFVLVNEASLIDYHQQIDFLIGRSVAMRPRGIRRPQKNRDRWNRRVWYQILSTLQGFTDPISLSDLSQALAGVGRETNAERIRTLVRRLRPLVRSTDVEGETLVRLTESARSLLSLIARER